MDKILKCFISAPAGSETNALRNILNQNGVQSVDAFDFNVGDSISATIKSKIKAADFAIVVISSLNANVFYELGICEGLGKPIFIIIDDDKYDAPPFINNYIFLRSSMHDVNFLAISLEKFTTQLRNNKSALRSPRKKFRRKAVTSEFSYSLAHIESMRSQSDPAELEKYTHQIFKKLSISVERVSDKAKGVDFAIWSDSLSNIIGNVVFVELKYGNLNERRIYEAELQLQHYLERSEARSGILLYLDKTGKRFKENYSISPLILRYDLEDFVTQIGNSSFEDTVLSKRNNMVHGIK